MDLGTKMGLSASIESSCVSNTFLLFHSNSFSVPPGSKALVTKPSGWCSLGALSLDAVLAPYLLTVTCGAQVPAPVGPVAVWILPGTG